VELFDEYDDGAFQLDVLLLLLFELVDAFMLEVDEFAV
jgi:hypothetical protein